MAHPRPTPTRRFIRRAVVSLAAGLVASIASGVVGVVLIHTSTRRDPFWFTGGRCAFGAIESPNPALWGGWYWEAYHFSYCDVVRCHDGKPLKLHDCTPFESIEDYASERRRGRWPHTLPPGSAFQLREALERDVIPGFPTTMLDAVTVGWPLRSFRSTRVCSFDWAANQRHVLLLREGMPAFGPGEHGWLYLPTHPVWLHSGGLIGNTGVWASAIYAAVAIPAATTRALRTRRSRCPTCAYPRAGLPETTTCPECGTGPPQRTDR